MPTNQRRTPYVAALLFVAITVSPALAVPPSVDVVFVDPRGLEGLIEVHFGVEAAQRVQIALAGAVAAEAPLRNPYGEPFIAIRETSAILRMLRDLWPDAADRSRIDAYRTFLNELNKAPLVRAVVLTPGYSGCAMVLFRVLESGARSGLEMSLPAHQYKGCPSIYGADFKMIMGLPLD